MTDRSSAAKERASEPKERILEAAETLFARYGLAKTTLADIARRAHLSKATLYHHFPDGKESIFRDAVGVIIETQWRCLVDHVHEGKTAREQLQRYLSERIAIFDREILIRGMDPDVWADLKPWIEHALKAHLERERELIRELLTAGEREGSMSGVDVALGARIIQSVLQGLTVDAPIETTARQRKRETDQLIAFVERGLGIR